MVCSSRMIFSLAVALLFSIAAQPLRSQTVAHSSPIPKMVEHDGHYALMVDGAPFLMLGAQVNNSSAWAATLPQVWPTVASLHLNTIEAPVYWEALEPEQGKFDFAQVDTLVDQARQHNVRLVLLWFGTWKNGSGHYTPQWMKLNTVRYPHVVAANGGAVDSLSPHSEATLQADKLAFSTLMRHLKAKDPQQTVIMVQVENESGTWGTVRDHSPAAEALFKQDVPAAALKAMGKQRGGSWQSVFGDEADGFFHSWYIASYINQVAAAGKAEYPLPMYVNAALRDPINPGKQGSWESGGPTDDVLPLWKAAAPSIDVIAPDIYMPEYAKYMKTLDLYQRPDNALMVPETGNAAEYARYCFGAIGHGSIGWSPFGMDMTGFYNAPLGAAKLDDATLKQFRYNFTVLAPIDRLIAKLNFEGKVKGSSEDDAVHTQRLDFSDWTAVVSYGLPQYGGYGMAAPGNKPPTGEALVAQLRPNEFLVTGYAARIDFEPSGKLKGKQRQFLSVEEGSFVAGKWIRSRIWNGDQTDFGMNFVDTPELLKVTLATY
jgi:beta-galactosidase GanA